MRPAALLSLLLVAALAAALGFRVLWGQSATVQAPLPGAMPAMLGGKPQGHVYTSVVEEPDDVNPYTAHGGVARRYVLAYTHEALVDIDPDTGALRPALAQSFELAADGTGCTFTLRDGVRFADGSPMTMADVMFGWELASAGHLPLGFVGDAFGRVAAATALDERRLSVTFRGVHFAALRAIGESWVVGQRRFFVERVAEQARAQGQPVPPVQSLEFATLLRQVGRECGPGTGPYVLQNEAAGASTWRRRQDLLLVRNPHSWRREAQPGTWNFAGVRLLFRDRAMLFSLFASGDSDWYVGPEVDAVLETHPDLARTSRKLAYDFPTLGVFRVLWNCRRPPFGDARVRRALGLLFDRDALQQKFPHHTYGAVAFAKPGSPDYPTDLRALAFDPSAARRLLRECGFDADGATRLRVVLLAPTGSAEIDAAVEGLRGAALQAGLDLKVRMLDFASYVAERKLGAWDGELAQQSFRAWGDPYDLLHGQGVDNVGGWQNAEADRLLELARTQMDPAERARTYRQLHTIVHTEQPATLLFHPRVQMLLNAHVQDAKPGLLGLSLERAWVAREFQRE